MKLSALLHEYGANAFVMVDAGNGSAYGNAGVLVEVDEAVRVKIVVAQVMRPIVVYRDAA